MAPFNPSPLSLNCTPSSGESLQLSGNPPSYHPRFRHLVDATNIELSNPSINTEYVSNVSHLTLSRHDEIPSPTFTSPVAPALSSSGKPLRVGLVMTTQPQSGHPSETTDGRTECIFNSIMDKALLLNTPGFPRPIPRAASEDGYAIHDIAGKGKGLVATRAYGYGELIASERPILIAPTGLKNIGISLCSDVEEPHEDDEALRSAAVMELEKYLKVALSRMNSERRRDYLALQSLHREGDMEIGRLVGIMDLNSFSFKLPFSNGESSGDDTTVEYGAVFKKLSRINHSCSPNAIWSWDLSSLSIQLYASRPISEGEEITISYCDILLPFSERKKALSSYNFACTCDACLRPMPSTLNRMKLRGVRSNVPALLKWLSDFEPPSNSTAITTSPQNDQVLLLKATTQLLHIIVSEGLESHRCYAEILHRLACIHLILGNRTESARYAKRRNVWDAMNHSVQEAVEKVTTELDAVDRASQSSRFGIESKAQTHRRSSVSAIHDMSMFLSLSPKSL